MSARKHWKNSPRYWKPTTTILMNCMIESNNSYRPTHLETELEILKNSLAQYIQAAETQIRVSSEMAQNSARFNVLVEKFFDLLKIHEDQCQICRSNVATVCNNIKRVTDERKERITILTNFWKPILIAILSSGWIVTLLDWLTNRR